MGDIPAGWQAVIGLVMAALTAAVAALFNTRRADRLAADARKDSQITDLMTKLDKCQDDKLKIIEGQLALATGRQQTDERVARSLEELSNAVKKGLPL